jgi:transposase
MKLENKMECKKATGHKMEVKNHRQATMLDKSPTKKSPTKITDKNHRKITDKKSPTSNDARQIIALFKSVILLKRALEEIIRVRQNQAHS